MAEQFVRSNLVKKMPIPFTLPLRNLQQLGELMHDILGTRRPGMLHSGDFGLSLSESLNIALENLRHHVDECGARIHAGELPTVTRSRPKSESRRSRRRIIGVCR